MCPTTVMLILSRKLLRHIYHQEEKNEDIKPLFPYTKMLLLVIYDLIPGEISYVYFAAGDLTQINFFR